MLRELRRHHKITYLTLYDDKAEAEARGAAAEYCDELVCVPHHNRKKFTPGFYAELAINLSSSLPYAIKKYESRNMRREIESRVNSGAFDVAVCDFLAPAVNLPTKLGCATVLFQHNVEAMIWKRYCAVQTNAVKSMYLRQQWKKMAAFERAMCRRFDSVVTVSAEDREIIRRDYGATRVYDVPSGVDVGFFRPSGNFTSHPNSLVFTGSMDWLPNGDGIRYFIEQILPLIKTRIPDVRLVIVGRNPDSHLLEVAKNDPAITVTGRVEDVRPYMEKAVAFIVPLRIGSGTRLKIFEAMAMEKPIISTTIGAEGLPVVHDRDLLLADTPESFAQEVVRVLSDRDLASRLGQQAAEYVRREFDWARAAEEFSAFCERAIELNLKRDLSASFEVTRGRRQSAN